MIAFDSYKGAPNYGALFAAYYPVMVDEFILIAVNWGWKNGRSTG
jgi:hypothetical protein